MGARSRIAGVRAGRLLACFLAATAVFGTARGAEDPVERARALLAAGRAKEAADALRPLADDPANAGDVRLQTAAGDAFLAAGDPTGAVVAFRAAVRVQPGPAERLRLARALLAAAREAIDAGARRAASVVPWLEDANAAATAALADAPDEDTKRRLLRAAGEARWLLGDLPVAIASLSDPALAADVAGQELLARVLYAAKEFGRAADAWGRAGNERGRAAAWSAAKDPRAVSAYAALALARPDDEDLADDAVRAAVYVDGGQGLDVLLAAASVPETARPAIARMRGRLAERRGRFGDAATFYRAVRAARPESIDAQRDLARTLLSGAATDPARAEEAISLFRGVLASRPDDPDARAALEWRAIADATNAHRDWPDRRALDRAVAILRELAESAPSDPAAWAQYGNGARVGGDAAAAVAAFDRAVDANPFDAAVWNDRGIALVAAGRIPDAIASFEKALSIDSGDTAARQNLARRLRLVGDDGGADGHLAAAIRTARATDGPVDLYRALVDRGIRARRRPSLR